MEEDNACEVGSTGVGKVKHFNTDKTHVIAVTVPAAAQCSVHF